MSVRFSFNQSSRKPPADYVRAGGIGFGILKGGKQDYSKVKSRLNRPTTSISGKYSSPERSRSISPEFKELIARQQGKTPLAQKATKGKKKKKNPTAA